MSNRSHGLVLLPLLFLAIGCQNIEVENGFFHSETAHMALPVHKELSNEAFQSKIEPSIQEGAIRDAKALSFIEQAIAEELKIDRSAIILKSGEDAPKLDQQKENILLTLNVFVKSNDVQVVKAKDSKPFLFVSMTWKIEWAGRTALRSQSDKNTGTRLKSVIDSCLSAYLKKKLIEIGGKPESARWKLNYATGLDSMSTLLPPKEQ